MRWRAPFASLRAAAPPAQHLLRRAIVVHRGSRLDDEAGTRLMVMSLLGAATVLVLEPLGVSSVLFLGRLVAPGEFVSPVGPRCTPLRLFALALLAEWLPLLVTSASSVLIQPAKGLVIAPFVEWERLAGHSRAALLAVLAEADHGCVAGAALALPVVTVSDVSWDRSVESRMVCGRAISEKPGVRGEAVRRLLLPRRERPGEHVPCPKTHSSLIGRAGTEPGGSSVASEKTLPPGSECQFVPGGSPCTSRSGSPAHRLRDRGLGRVTAGVRVQVPTDGDEGRRVGALHEHGRGSEHVRGGG